MARHLVQAVSFLHECGFVHRDIKRPNVRFTGSEAVLIDFDSACHWRVGDPLLSEVAGTATWLAPEVARSEGYGASADVWGIGLVLLDEMLQLTHSMTRGTVAGVSSRLTLCS